MILTAGPVARIWHVPFRVGTEFKKHPPDPAAVVITTFAVMKPYACVDGRLARTLFSPESESGPHVYVAVPVVTDWVKSANRVTVTVALPTPVAHPIETDAEGSGLADPVPIESTSSAATAAKTMSGTFS